MSTGDDIIELFICITDMVTLVSGKQHGADVQFCTEDRLETINLDEHLLENACDSATAVTECYVSYSEGTVIYFHQGVGYKFAVVFVHFMTNVDQGCEIIHGQKS